MVDVGNNAVLIIGDMEGANIRLKAKSSYTLKQFVAYIEEHDRIVLKTDKLLIVM